MHKLLLDCPQQDLPEEYRCARIRGRAGGRVRDWSEAARGEPTTASSLPEALRRRRDSARWLWRQMHRRLRRIMAPVFFFLELKTMLAALRLLRAGRHDGIEALLAPSLLAAPLQRIFTRAASVEEALTRLEQEAGDELPALTGIAALARDAAPAAVEARIMQAFLLRLDALKLDPAVAAFFRRRIDIINAVTAARAAAMTTAARPAFFPGGSRSPAALARGRLAVAPAAASPTGVENTLLGLLGRSVRR